MTIDFRRDCARRCVRVRDCPSGCAGSCTSGAYKVQRQGLARDKPRSGPAVGSSYARIILYLIRLGDPRSVCSARIICSNVSSFEGIRGRARKIGEGKDPRDRRRFSH